MTGSTVLRNIKCGVAVMAGPTSPGLEKIGMTFLAGVHFKVGRMGKNNIAGIFFFKNDIYCIAVTSGAIGFDGECIPAIVTGPA